LDDFRVVGWGDGGGEAVTISPPYHHGFVTTGHSERSEGSLSHLLF